MSMASHFAFSWRPFLAVVAGSAVLFACTLEAPAKKKKPPVDCSVEQCYTDVPVTYEDPIEPDRINSNSGVFPASERPANNADGGGGNDDAGGGGEPVVTPYCGDTLAPGDLAIVEVMIASVTGSGDSGEWIEIQNVRDCTLKLKGVSVASPRGAAGANTAIVPDDLELAPHATFVVANSADPAKNHNIPGTVIAWNATDVLKNSGDAVKVSLGATVIDSIEYPSFTNLTAGRALSFPSDCIGNDRKLWDRWSLTFNEWAPGFKGTPNRPNADVSCF
jgi:hypothetical protein